MSLVVDKILGDVLMHTHEKSDNITVDTQSNVLATTPDAGQLAYATDTQEFYVYADGSWSVASIKLSTTAGRNDMGAHISSETDDSDPRGYGEDYIAEKRLYSVSLGYSSREEEGAIRVDSGTSPKTLEIYLGSKWNDILYDLTMENSDNEFEHTPNEYAIDVRSGNSNFLSLSGLPLVLGYKVSMGAYSSPQTLEGGSF